MSKHKNRSIWIKAVPLFILALSTLLHFQNCGKFEPVQDGFAELSSVDVSIHHMGEDHSTPPEIIEVISTNYQATLADRYFLSKQFLTIFGPSAATYINTSNLAYNKVDFGSPCSLYENYKYEASTGLSDANLMESCSLSSASDALGANLMASDSVTHQARVSALCANLTFNAGTLDYLLNQIRPAENMSTLPLATNESLQKLIRLFYRNNEDVATDLVQSLQIMVHPSAPLRSEWQNVVYTVCTSSGWQVL